jgi:hypothetical protein
MLYDGPSCIMSNFTPWLYGVKWLFFPLGQKNIANSSFCSTFFSLGQKRITSSTFYDTLFISYYVILFLLEVQCNNHALPRCRYLRSRNFIWGESKGWKLFLTVNMTLKFNLTVKNNLQIFDFFQLKLLGRSKNSICTSGVNDCTVPRVKIMHFTPSAHNLLFRGLTITIYEFIFVLRLCLRLFHLIPTHPRLVILAVYPSTLCTEQAASLISKNFSLTLITPKSTEIFFLHRMFSMLRRSL